jgi:hypothetical protein
MGLSKYERRFITCVFYSHRKQCLVLSLHFLRVYLSSVQSVSNGIGAAMWTHGMFVRLSLILPHNRL